MSTSPGPIERAVREDDADSGARELSLGGALFGTEATAEQLDLLRDQDGALPANVFRLVRRGRGPGRPPGSTNKATKQLARMIVQEHGDPVMRMAGLGAMPLDQAYEAVKLAAGFDAKERQLHDLASALQQKIIELGPETTQEFRDDLKDMFGQVMSTMRRMGAKSVDQVIKLVAIKHSADKETAPYVHGKQPIAVDVNAKGDMILNIPNLTDPAIFAGDIAGEELSDEEMAAIELALGSTEDAEFEEADSDDADSDGDEP